MVVLSLVITLTLWFHSRLIEFILIVDPFLVTLRDLALICMLGIKIRNILRLLILVLKLSGGGLKLLDLLLLQRELLLKLSDK